MGKLKVFMVALCVFGMFVASQGCPSPQVKPEGNKGETGDTKDASPPTDRSDPGETTPEVKEETGPITMKFEPADGSQIDVDGDGSCIKVTFSHRPCSKGQKAELKREGSTVADPVAFDFEPKDPKVAKICPLGVLRQGAKYTLKVTVHEKVGGAKCATEGTKYEETKNYTTKEPYKNDPPAKAGLGINLRLDKITKPSGVGDLISGLNPEQIPPILVTLHSRDEGNSGNLTFIGGLGKAKPGGKPHQGDDIVDTDKNPVSLALIGKFNGRAFYVGPTTFLLAISGFAIRIDNFSLTGVFSKDGKNVEFAKLTGILDPAFIEKQFGLNICQLLAGECFKGEDGKDRVLIAGTVTGIPNPLPFSAFVTSPVYLSTDFDGSNGAVFYTTEEIKDTDVKFTLSTCKGSSDEQKPCDTSKEAKVAVVPGDGTIKLQDGNKQGLYTFANPLEKGTWHKLEMEVKNAAGTTFKTFTIFKTKE